MKKFVRVLKNFKCSKIMCSNFQIFLLLTCFVVLSTQKKHDEPEKPKNLLTPPNKPKREAALADGSEFFGLADALKPKVHSRYSGLAARFQNNNNFRVFDSLEGFRAGLDDLGHDKVETYIIKTEEDENGRPSAVYKVFASDPKLVADAFGNNFHKEVKSHKSNSKVKFIHTAPKSQDNRGFPSFDVNQVKTRNFPLKNNHNGPMPAIVVPYQNHLKGNAVYYRQGNGQQSTPVQVHNLNANQVQPFNAHTQATPVPNCLHKQAQGYAYPQPQTSNGQGHQAVALSNQSIQQPRFNGHSSNNNAQNYNHQQQQKPQQQQQQQQAQKQQQVSNAPIQNALSNNYNLQNGQTQVKQQNQNLNHNQNNQINTVAVNHQSNQQAGAFNTQTNNQGNQADKGLYNNPFNGNPQHIFNNNNNVGNLLPPQALTHVIPGPVHNTPQGTVKYFNVAVTSNDHVPIQHIQPNQLAQPNYANTAINQNQEENAKFLSNQPSFNVPHTSQNEADSLTMMKETGPSYGFGGEHGDLSASLDALSGFSKMPTHAYVDTPDNYDYPTATITHLGGADANDQVPAYAQGDKGLSHFSTQKLQQLNTDTIDSAKYTTDEHFKPSHFLGAINNAGPPTSDNYEYPDPSVLAQKGEYAAPVFETESLYANHRYQ